jgi:hypothetical protein
MMALSYKTKMTEIPVKKTPGIQVIIADDPSLLRDRIKYLLNSIKNVCVTGESENFKDINNIIPDWLTSKYGG